MSYGLSKQRGKDGIFNSVVLRPMGRHIKKEKRLAPYSDYIQDELHIDLILQYKTIKTLKGIQENSL